MKVEKPRYVETLPRRGYRFVGEVRANDSLHRNSGLGLQAGEEVVAKIFFCNERFWLLVSSSVTAHESAVECPASNWIDCSLAI